MKRGGGDDESREIEGEEDAEGADDALPRSGLGIDQQPGTAIVGEEPLLVTFKERDAFEDEVDEHEGEAEDSRGGGFHVEAGEHEGEAEHGTGVDDEEQVRAKVKLETVVGAKGAENRDEHRTWEEDKHVAPGKPEAGEGQGGAAQDEDEQGGEDNAGQPFDKQEPEAGDRSGHNHAQGAVFGFFGDEVAADERDIERHQKGDLRDEYDDGNGQRGDVILGEIAAAVEEAFPITLPACEVEQQQHQVLKDEKGPETDVSAFLAEKLPQFVAQVAIKHGVGGGVMEDSFKATADVHQAQVEILEGFLRRRDIVNGQAAFDQRAQDLTGADSLSQ